MFSKYYFSVKPNVLFVGEVYGMIADFADDIVSKHTNSLIFVAGNLGVGTYDPAMTKMELFYLEDICRKKGNIVVAVRGNRDNPMFFENLEKKSKAIKDYLTNVLFIDDYSIVETSIGNILCIGGSISIDRSLRKKVNDDFDEGGMIWFENEGVKQIDLTPIYDDSNAPEDEEKEDINPFAQVIKNKKIKIILSHTAPIFTIPDKNDTKDDIDKEGEYLLDVYNFLNDHDNSARYWIYGKYSSNINTNNMLSGIKYNLVARYSPNIKDYAPLSISDIKA